MRRRLSCAVRAVVVLILAVPVLAGTLAPTGRSVEGEVLVKIKPGASQSDIASLRNLADADEGERVSSFPSGALWRLRSRSKNTEAVATALQKNPNVVYAEPNYIVRLVATPNDPSFPLLWGLKNTGQNFGTHGSDISAEAAWNVTTGSASVVVGVVDTGIDYTHPDLAANIWSNPGGKGNAACAAGTHGFNAITKTCDPKDDHYHGTHVAGTIGAVGNNAIGVTGVAWTASIMGLKFLDAYGYGTTANAIAAIEFAVQAKIDGVNVRVLSNSWAGGSFSKALLDEINKANDNDILFVAAAGNDASSNDTYALYPANYATPNMISVAATDNRDLLAYFSNYGATTVHLAAPGVGIYSTYPGNSYTSLSGTSMATPHVSGVAALLLSNAPSLTTSEVKSAILDNTDPVPGLSGRTVTGGRLNAARALGLPPEPEFTLAVTPSSQTVVRGNSTSYTINITQLNGFSGNVQLSVSGLPEESTASFSPNPATTTATLTVTTTGATPLYNNKLLTITGTSGALVRTATASLSVVSTPSVTACPLFTPTNSVNVATPISVATGDFNRDGRTDLVFANVDWNRISISLGTGSGGFQPIVFYFAGTAPLSVAVGDFNGDGKADLAAANSGSHNVSILLGNGNGTFQTAVHYDAGASPFAVAAGDFNGDGASDLAVANNGTADVSILLGNGDGTFQTAVDYDTASGPFALTIADLDSDGNSDLAVAAYNTGAVSILSGNGDGTFDSAVDYATAAGASSVVASDFDADGDFDLAVANYSANNVSVLGGNGDGTFAAAVHHAVGNGPYSVAIGDFNGDGKDDLATANNLSTNISLLMGTGAGTFIAATPYAAASEPNQVAVGDFDRDGKDDLAVANLDAQNVSILLNRGTCTANCNTIAAPSHYAVTGSPYALTAGDFDGDGDVDVATAARVSNSVAITLGNGDGTFSAGVSAAAGTNPDSLTSGDFNHDGQLDAVAANSGSNNVSVLLGNGDGTLQSAVAYATGTTPRAITAADLDRDGNLDLAVANGGSNDVSILLGEDDGTFASPLTTAAGTSPLGIASGDFNRDGKPDLAVANSGSGNVSILTGNGDGTFLGATFSAGTTPRALYVDDFNRDGKPDLAVANGGSNNVSVLLGNGDGTFQTAVHYATGTIPFSVTGGDFNDDGRIDLAVSNSASANVSILLGIEGGAFQSAINSASGNGPATIVATDVNRDGKPDLAVAGSGSASLVILRNHCPVPDLTITKTHSGTFAQGSTGKTYTITVTNSGAAPTSGTVSVTDSLPPGLNATAISGTGWTCAAGALTCTRNAVLAPGASYPPITLTVNVTGSAPSSVTNTVTVSGGGELNAVNSTASDETTITAAVDLGVSKSHSGSFVQGDTGRKYTIVVRNGGSLATTGTVTVTDTLPAGLTATAIAGSGWTCTLGNLTCTRNNALAGSSNYPAITVTVNVAANAPALVTNTATVSGGGDAGAGNNTATDPTTIWSTSTCGTFGAFVRYDAQDYQYALEVADFNGDSNPDVAVGHIYTAGVSILLGNGDGTLQTATNVATGNNPGAMTKGDFNGDGKTDLVVSNSSPLAVAVLLGNGDGTFAPPISTTAAASIRWIGTGHFDNDGNLDVVAANQYSNTVTVFLGYGNGSLRTGVTYTTGNNPADVAISDVDRNGTADLVVSHSNGVSLLLGNGDGTFAAAVSIGTFSGEGGAVAAGDFNRDGNPDYVVASTYYKAWVVMGDGDGTFGPMVEFNADYSVTAIVIEDINGDGNADMLMGSYYGLRIFAGIGDGTFEPSTFVDAYGARYIAVSDFNKDGRADVAVTDYYDGRVGIALGGCPDLTITKSHTGNFSTGSSGTYTLTVTNSSGGTTQGTITVTDVLPQGLTLSNIYGYDWQCTQATVSCTRTYPMSAGMSSTITVNVMVAGNAPSTVTNTATVSGGGDGNTANNTASDPTTIIPVPDMTVTMTHDGMFAHGQTGRAYTITAKNSGGAATTGMVTVAAAVYGLTVTDMSGPGWSCTIPSRTCTRNDTLAANTTYPPITLTVNVPNTTGSWASSSATVSGGGEANTANNYASDYTEILTTPTNMNARTVSTTRVDINWDSVYYATQYQILRSSNGGPFITLGTPPGTAFVDMSVSPNTTYVYRVRAVNGSTIGALGIPDLATTIVFTDDPLVPGVTPMKTAHITQLRAAVNAVRSAAGLGAATFTDPVLNVGMAMKAIHVTELRSKLDEARTILALTPLVYTNPTLGGASIKAAHLRELRSGVN